MKSKISNKILIFILIAIVFALIGCSQNESQINDNNSNENNNQHIVHEYVDGICKQCQCKNIEYIIVDQNGKTYNLFQYSMLLKETGKYPNAPEHGKAYISSLKESEIDVYKEQYYSLSMTFKGWYKDKMCTQLLGFSDISLDVGNEPLIVYAKVLLIEHVGPF